ncbi:MAG TPA: bifunctional DNA-formamidopyrimidine glycosylase/DNA-(apurinic or apyrimidinic site) lyase [Bryobacteraceae bacterium]|nr:bifunctional DNA-formamidopyrimidine glycosylase/DNA-(apurinic or apyrimidinic site) lyase [Bryobacteraceae bacterium]
MPELPEVETVVRSLAPRVAGRHIVSAEFLAPRVLRHAKDLTPEVLQGQSISSIERRGKFIVILLERGALVIHLGMTGKLLFDTPVTPYTRAIFGLDDSTLLYEDVRQFGSIEYSAEVPERVGRLGPEPLEITPEEFYRALHARNTVVKAALLNQRVVRGMGNIYTDEALFRARIDPRTKANRLSRVRTGRLHAAMVKVLREAIRNRGSSISNYVDSEGRKGGFQILHRVYGRAGKPCRECGTPIRKTVVAQRGTHYCPKCQK